MDKLNFYFHKVDVKALQIAIASLLVISLCFLDSELSMVTAIILMPVILWHIFKEPASGVYALIILLASLRSVPDRVELPVVLFVLICSIILIKFIHNLDMLHLKKTFNYTENKVLFAFGCLIIINLFVGIFGSVNLREWFRGAVPFLFVFVFFACQRFFKTKRDIYLCLVSIITCGGILVSQGISIFFRERLWIPKPYVRIHSSGEWLKIYLEDGTAYDRITKIFPQSTDAVYLVSFFVLMIFLLLIFSRKKQVLTLPLSYGILLSMVITYSRSFMVCLVFGFLFLIGYFLWKKDIKRIKIFVVGFLFTFLFVLATVEFFRLEPFKDQWLRSGAAIKTVYSYSSKRGDKKVVEDSRATPNIQGRLEEIVIAFNMFRNRPLLGNGFGVKHDIYYDVGFGRVEKFTKGYIHNWLFYFLMTTGVIGTIIYSSLYVIPIVKGLRLLEKEEYFVFALISTLSMLLLNLYSMFFGCFRLISFNVLLGVFLSIPISLHLIGDKNV